MLTAATGRSIADHWKLASFVADSCLHPADLDSHSPDWIPAIVPWTVAQALQQAGRWTIGQDFDFDSRDWWYRCEFDGQTPNEAARQFVHFRGLATLADVWLNGNLVLQSDNMFMFYVADATP